MAATGQTFPYLMEFHGFRIYLRTAEEIREAKQLIHLLCGSKIKMDGENLVCSRNDRRISKNETLTTYLQFHEGKWYPPTPDENPDIFDEKAMIYLTLVEVDEKHFLCLSRYVNSTKNDEDRLYLEQEKNGEPSADKINQFCSYVLNIKTNNQFYREFQESHLKYRRFVMIVQS